jgi:hypothetical protein
VSARMMVRPGPYINAEWGFLGFGAIPLWFHEKFPDSHMRNPEGLRTKLYDYHHPALLEYTERWFRVLYREVLKPHMGRGRPILFLQIDNETNFMWQSIYNHDYGAGAVERYHAFLKARYLELGNLNSKHKRSWRNWEEIVPPSLPGLNLAEDQDWYRFQDQSIHSYLKTLRGFWESLGVSEPKVMFTLAESYNALGHGLLPNFKLRNDPGSTGMMTLNLYPKTYETPSKPLLNLPFKADHDTVAMDSASDAYLGSRQEWLMGPEIQGGWWKGIDVSTASRQQTYLSTLGHGLKAQFVYYFTEGDNWQSGWAKQKIKPLFKKVRTREAYKSLPDQKLSDAFWKELQREVDQRLIVGFDAWKIMNEDEHEAETLFFDAPLDTDARPRTHFSALANYGKRVIAPNAEFLAEATEVSDAVTIVKDTAAHVPARAAEVNSLLMNAEWSGGLVGYLLQAGINPRIAHWGLGNPGTLATIAQSKVILRHDPGQVAGDQVAFYKSYLATGGTVINLLGDSLAVRLGLGQSAVSDPRTEASRAMSRISNGSFDVAAKPLFTYTVRSRANNCEAILTLGYSDVAYRCSYGKGTFIQIGALFHDAFNSDHYAHLTDVPQRRAFLAALLRKAGVASQVSVEGADRVVVFARRSYYGQGLWLTIKNGRETAVSETIRIDGKLLRHAVGSGDNIVVEELMAGRSRKMTLQRVIEAGIRIELAPNGSEAVFIRREARAE